MGEKQYSYDSACEDLAEHFLMDEGIKEEALLFHTQEMAQAIQDAVESYCGHDIPSADLESPPIHVDDEIGAAYG